MVTTPEHVRPGWLDPNLEPGDGLRIRWAGPIPKGADRKFYERYGIGPAAEVVPDAEAADDGGKLAAYQAWVEAGKPARTLPEAEIRPEPNDTPKPVRFDRSTVTSRPRSMFGSRSPAARRAERARALLRKSRSGR